MPNSYLILAVAFWFLFSFFVGRTASSLHRSPVTWFLLALLCNPLLVLAILLCFIGDPPPAIWFLLALLCNPLLVFAILWIIGDPEATAALREREDRIRERHPERKDIREAALNEMNCPHCGAAVNPITEDGLHSSEREPWLLICNRCQGTIEPDV